MDRLLARLTAIAALTVALVVGTASPASACSCAPWSDEEAFEHADAVFTGTPVDRQDPDMTGEWSSADPTYFRFEVDAVHKGDVAADQLVTSEVSGASCGLEISGEGPFLVFATNPDSSEAADLGAYYAGLCGGTRPVAQAPVPFDDISPPAAATGDPMPPPANRDDSSIGTTAVWLVVGAGILAAAAAVGITATRRRPRPT